MIGQNLSIFIPFLQPAHSQKNNQKKKFKKCLLQCDDDQFCSDVSWFSPLTGMPIFNWLNFIIARLTDAKTLPELTKSPSSEKNYVYVGVSLSFHSFSKLSQLHNYNKAK